MTELNKSEVEQLLTGRGLAALLPVRRAGRRLGCTVWDARLLTPYGDADSQIQVYLLGRQPESVVDLEEEITALTDAASSRTLVREIRDEEWVILITTMPGDAAIFERFFEEGVPASPAITYHPQLDRILGGDYFHQLQQHWLKACIAPIDRAMEINALLTEAQNAYKEGPDWPGKLERPLPNMLAILTIPNLEVMGAPVGCGEFAVMQLLIGSPEVIQVKPPQGEHQLQAFARQLSGFLKTQHRIGMCFSRKAGCCLRPEFLLADGALTDAYFITHLQEEEQLRYAMRTDIWNVLIVICEMGQGDPRAVGAALTTAIMQYSESEKFTGSVGALIKSVAEDIVNRNVGGLEAIVHMLLKA